MRGLKMIIKKKRKKKNDNFTIYYVLFFQVKSLFIFSKREAPYRSNIF